jgi:hypothetical protein
MPSWDLSFLLHFLRGSNFEPLLEIDLMSLLSLKTTFLIALASAARVSELPAIDSGAVHFKHDYTEVLLTPCINFLPRNLSPGEAQGKLRTYTIKALTSSVDARDTEEGLLCPVRALRAYLDRVSAFRQGRSRLFLSTRAPHAEITKNTIFTWIKKVIKWTYESATAEDRRVCNVRAHDIRGFATSWSFKNSVTLLDVLRAGTWKHHSTFSDYYLKDVATIRQGMLSLGTLSVAQQRVFPSAMSAAE